MLTPLASSALTAPVPHYPTRSHYATGSACARLPRVFFIRLCGWLPLELASTSIGSARRNHALIVRPLWPGSDWNVAEVRCYSLIFEV